MSIQVVRTNLEAIQNLRKLFLQENNFQFVHNKCHLYGWADTYEFLLDDQSVGYGSVWGKDMRENRDCIFEFYLLPPFRQWASDFFDALHHACGAAYMECQTNDKFTAPLFFEQAHQAEAEYILFEDHTTTAWTVPGVNFYRKEWTATNPDDHGGYVLKRGKTEVATGGLMLNYNFPYADIHMEVNEDYRRQGLGTLIVQELKKVAYNINRVPAARCNVKNTVSKATLLKAGFRVCGYLLSGSLKT